MLEAIYLLLLLITLYYLRWLYYMFKIKPDILQIPLPFIGHAHKATKPADIFKDKYAKLHGTFLGLMGSEIVIILSNGKSCEIPITSMQLLRKSKVYNYLHRWLGQGLLTSTGKFWAEHRKLITPTFHFKILESFIPIFNTRGDILLQILENEVDKGSTDIYPLLCRYTLDVICESAMGTSIDAQRHPNSKYEEAVKHMCKVTADRAFSLFQRFDFFYKFSANYRKELESLKILHGYTLNVIAERREKLGDKKLGEVDDVGAKKRVAFLDLLLQADINGMALKDEEIREEVDTFMFEGHDTVASASSFALYCIAEHQEIQAKILDEQRVIFSDNHQRNVTYNDLQEMKYLEKVIKEVLRLYPSVPFVARETDQAVKFGERIFPKGCQVIFMTYLLHRDPKVFPDPERFDPERFSIDCTAKHPYGYLPFSAGPRNCIGQKFAMLELKATISKIIRRFTLLPVVPKHVIELLPETTLKSKNGILIGIKKRELF